MDNNRIDTDEKKTESGGKCFGLWGKTILIIFAVVVVLNALAWISRPFSDWYTLHIMPIWLNTLGRATSLAPFSVGEWLFIAACLSLAVAFLLWIPAIILKLFGKAAGFCRGVLRFYKIYALLLGIVALIMTLNCFIPYHCTPLDPNPDREARAYSTEELYALEGYICERVNELAETLPRDENGWIIADFDETCKSAEDALRALSDYDARLSGWYPSVKKMHFSNMLTHMGIGGYFLPFTMEANVNGLMYEGNWDTIAHELSHTHGFLFENEANFIAFLACTKSDDPLLQYTGYLGVLTYVWNDCWENYTLASASAPEGTEVELPPGAPSERVWLDWVFLKPEVRARVEEEDKPITDIISSESIREVTETVSDISMKLNGVELGFASYGEVVGMLLEYYDGVLYNK